MKRFVAVMGNKVIAVLAKDAEGAFETVGRDILSLKEPIDTGDVDIDSLYEFPSLHGAEAKVMVADD